MSASFSSPARSGSGGSHRKKRRHFRKAGPLLGVATGMCFLIALFFAGMALFSTKGSSSLQMKMGGLFGGAGLALGLVRSVMLALQARRHQRGTQANPFAQPREHDEDSGMALLVALVLVGVLTTLSLHGLAAARSRVRAAESVLRAEQLTLAAEAAVWRAMQRLADDEDLLVDSLDEAWAAPEERLDPDGVRLVTRVADENRFFDLNALAGQTGDRRRPADDILIALLRQCGDAEPTARVQALRDWVDADGEGPREAAWYAAKKPAYPCPNAPLLSWGEIRWIEGFGQAPLDPASVRRAPDEERPRPADLLTLGAAPTREPARVNINTAPSDVLLGLLGSDQEGLVRSFLALREAAPMRHLEVLALTMDPLRMHRLRSWLDVKSSLFLIEARAERDGMRRVVRAQVHRSREGAVRPLRWML